MHPESYLGIGKDFPENRQNKAYKKSEQKNKNWKKGKATASEEIGVHSPFFFNHAFEYVKHKIPSITLCFSFLAVRQKVSFFATALLPV